MKTLKGFASENLSRRYRDQEIKEKLSLATNLLTLGLSQVEISQRLGVSVMTLHRWRKKSETWSREAAEQNLLTFELKLENDRLRRIVSSLALEIAESRDRLLLEPIDRQSTDNTKLPYWTDRSG